MKVFINRKSATPIQDQISAQIGQQVASGTLAPGERLPSIRGLATRLGVHHNTVLAAYKSLAARGVLEIKEGSGVRVTMHGLIEGDWRDGLAVQAMAAYFVSQARAQGYDDAAILEACRRALSDAVIHAVVVVNPHPDLQQLYLHELGRRLDFPISAMALEEVAGLRPDQRSERCFVTSTNHAASLQEVLGSSQAPVIFRLASTDDLLARVGALGPEALVGVVSSSPRFRFLLKELLAGTREESAVIDADLTDNEGLPGTLRLADLVITDSIGHETLSRVSDAALYLHRLLSDDTWPELARRLPPGAFREPTVRSHGVKA